MEADEDEARGFADCGDPASRARFLGRVLGTGGKPMAEAWPRGEQAWTHEQARAFIRNVVELFHRVDVDGLAQGFAEDCVVRFAEQPELRGRAALRELFARRLAKQKNYRLEKTLVVLEGNRMGNLWTGTWEDRDSGRKMAGRGVEFWTMRDGAVAVWDAAFNVWEAEGPRKSAVM
jgi:nuclear transport factor 2 (NTF2) superfamily protein